MSGSGRGRAGVCLRQRALLRLLDRREASQAPLGHRCRAVVAARLTKSPSGRVPSEDHPAAAAYLRDTVGFEASLYRDHQISGLPRRLRRPPPRRRHRCAAGRLRHRPCRRRQTAERIHAAEPGRGAGRAATGLQRAGFRCGRGRGPGELFRGLFHLRLRAAGERARRRRVAKLPRARRGRADAGAGRAIARERGACKLTLEVLQGNRAGRLYERLGFADFQLDPAMGNARFMQKWLG
jgi:hypothetical protein